MHVEQGFVESDLDLCGACKEESRSYKPLVCHPLAVVGPKLVAGHLCFRGPHRVFVSIAQSDSGYF